MHILPSTPTLVSYFYISIQLLDKVRKPNLSLCVLMFSSLSGILIHECKVVYLHKELCQLLFYFEEAIFSNNISALKKKEMLCFCENEVRQVIKQKKS